MSSKILLIGGTGYIGSALYEYLSKNHSITSIDLEWFGNYVNPANLVLDFRHLTKTFVSRFDVIILLAAHSSVPMCTNDCHSSFENNVDNFVNLLSKIDGQKLIYASSSSIYGDTGDKPVPETWHEFKPKNYYDLTKQIIDYYASLSPVDYYGLRFGTVNGYSPNLRIDIMINKMYYHAKTHGKIEIFNKEISRPILGIRDLCRAVQSIINSESKRGVYNLASFNATVNDISQEVAKRVSGVEIIDKGSSPSYNFSIDTSKFQTNFNFDFQESVASIVADLEAHSGYFIPTIRNERSYV